MAGNIIHTITRVYKDQSANSITFAENPTGNAEQNIDDNIAVAANHQVPWAATRSTIASLALYASGDVTVYTNDLSSGSPQDTIPLKAGQVLEWTLATDLIARCPFSGNVTTLYVTNAGAGAVVFKVRALLNV